MSSLSSKPDKNSSKDIQELLKIVARNKAKAVKEENFTLAKKAHFAQSQLEAALNDIKGLENSKKEAIQNDDFDQAQELTEEMQALKKHYLSQIDQKLLEDVPNDPRPSTSKSTASTITVKSNKSRSSSRSNFGTSENADSDEESEVPRKLFERIPISPPSTPPQRRKYLFENDIKPNTRKPRRLNDTHQIPRSTSTPTYVPIPEPAYMPTPEPTYVPTPKPELYIEPKPQLSKMEPLTRQPINKFYEKENQILPAIAKKKQDNKEDTFSNAGDEILTEEKLLNAINPVDRAYASQAVAHFGLETAANIYSKNWQNRRDALKDIKSRLKNNSTKHSPQSLLNTALPAIVKGLSDQLFNVYAEALDLLKYVSLKYLEKHGLIKSDGPKVVNRVYQILISRTGDTVSDGRFTPATHETINELIRGNSEMAMLYMQKFMQPFNMSGGSVRSDQGKAKIVWNAVNILKAPNSIISEKQICKFGNNCMNHTDSEVRNIGKNLILYVYMKGDRTAIRKTLPRGESSSNHLIRSLYAELDRIDGGKEVKTDTFKTTSRPSSRPSSVPTSRRKV
uniref:TOG domain-containing protein n=1 Tax=Acrobeloides nanus TaxID=290746 RepID=A0A914CAZ9_9BILA